MLYRVGCDEAGRGCVLGEMVFGLCLISDESMLHRPDIRDSKVLSAAQRASALAYLTTHPEIHIDKTVCSPKEIDEWVAHGGLNELCRLKVKELIIRALRVVYKKNQHVEYIHINLDTLSSDTVGYATLYSADPEILSILSRFFSKTKVLIAAHVKGDAKYKEISAASIVAKEERERLIAEAKAKYGDFGSGYPSDPKTKKWLVSNYRTVAGDIARKSWATWRDLGHKLGDRL